MKATYATGIIAEQLGISKTSLQHYIHTLEEQGFKVSRNSRMHRQFTNEDVQLLKSFLFLYKKQGYKLAEAAKTVLQPNFVHPTEELVFTTVPSNQVLSTKEVVQYEDISSSMQLMASHIYGIEQQNTQLISLIEQQRTQNELLLEQNATLKKQLTMMMQHITKQANNTTYSRQLNRVEQQNSAIMSVLNKLNNSNNPSSPLEAMNGSLNVNEVENSQAKGLLAKLFK